MDSNLLSAAQQSKLLNHEAISKIVGPGMPWLDKLTRNPPNPPLIKGGKGGFSPFVLILHLQVKDEGRN
jgi:hypothetical protein